MADPVTTAAPGSGLREAARTLLRKHDEHRAHGEAFPVTWLESEIEALRALAANPEAPPHRGLIVQVVGHRENVPEAPPESDPAPSTVEGSDKLGAKLCAECRHAGRHHGSGGCVGEDGMGCDCPGWCPSPPAETAPTEERLNCGFTRGEHPAPAPGARWITHSRLGCYDSADLAVAAAPAAPEVDPEEDSP